MQEASHQTHPTPGEPATLDLSVIAPAHNEQDNVGPLVDEITAALDPLELSYEIVIIDDGSTDDTPAFLKNVMARQPKLRVFRMLNTPPGKGLGQSAAFHAGFRAARGEVFAVLDADLQNVPDDIPAMLERMRETGAHVVQGDRSRVRRDGPWRQFSSWVGRVTRRLFLGDTVRDTGCSLRLIRREVAQAIPLEFRGMHRFIPITARRMGYTVVEVPVRHRPRTHGKTKYGTLDRAITGFFDTLAVRWMSKRRRPICYESVQLEDSEQPNSPAVEPLEAAR